MRSSADHWELNTHQFRKSTLLKRPAKYVGTQPTAYRMFQRCRKSIRKQPWRRASYSLSQKRSGRKPENPKDPPGAMDPGSITHGLRSKPQKRNLRAPACRPTTALTSVRVRVSALAFASLLGRSPNTFSTDSRTCMRTCS